VAGDADKILYIDAPAIIEPALAQAAQDMLTRNRIQAKRNAKAMCSKAHRTAVSIVTATATLSPTHTVRPGDQIGMGLEPVPYDLARTTLRADGTWIAQFTDPDLSKAA
jgi:hypothetical protein